MNHVWFVFLSKNLQKNWWEWVIVGWKDNLVPHVSLKLE